MISDRSIELIKKHEGLRLTPYKDSVGVLTVGYGHNLEVSITRQQADDYLKDDLQAVEQILDDYPWYSGLDPIRQAVVQNMVFNLGGPRFKLFKQTIRHIAAGNYSKAAFEMLDSKWARQVGRRADELSQMMLTGRWPV